MQILTIGHSTLTFDLFVARLQYYAVEVLVDVRSAPFSARCPHFNRPRLRAALKEEAIHYSYAGRALGGKPADGDLCQGNGRPDYDKIAAASSYRDGVDRLIRLARTRQVAVMCAEAEPEVCHRHNLLSRSLHARGIDVRHILADGSLSGLQQPWLFVTEGEEL